MTVDCGLEGSTGCQVRLHSAGQVCLSLVAVTGLRSSTHTVIVQVRGLQADAKIASEKGERRLDHAERFGFTCRA